MAGTTWLRVAAPASYARQPPAVHNAHSPDAALYGWWLGEVARRTVEVPEMGIFTVANGYASDLTFVYGEGGELFEPSAADHQRLLRFDEIRDLGKGETPRHAGELAFVFKAGKNNYGHVLVEMLPRLELLLAAGYDDLPLLIPSLPRALSSLVEQVVARAYDGRWPLLRMTTPLLQADRIVYPAPVARHNDRKSAIVATFAERMLGRMAARAAAGPKRIYVSRRGCGNRPLTNESEIEAIFAASGFEIVRPEDHAFETQIAIFRGAEFIAGPMGAAMTSIMFAPRSARILVLDPGTHDLFFYDLACLRGQSFAWAFSGPLVRADTTRLHAPWSMRTDVVETALRTMLE